MLSQEGFRWNPSTKMIECENDDLWKKYIAAHPHAKGIRGKQIEMYEELKITCGTYQAPNRWAKILNENHQMKTIEECSASIPSPSSEDASETDGTESYSGSPDYLSNGNHDPLRIQPARVPKQARGAGSLQDAMLVLASSVHHLADAVQVSNTTINASELLQAVMGIDDLDEGKQVYTFEFLNADPVKASAFMAYNDRMRRIYLFRLFGWLR